MSIWREAWSALHGVSTLDHWLKWVAAVALVVIAVQISKVPGRAATRLANWALLLMFAVLAMVYHFGPSFKQRFVPITPGALFCVAVWLLLGWLFKLYLVEFGGAQNYRSTYGAVAGAAILLLFFYIDALVLLIGAEINSEIDFALGKHPVRK